MNWAGRRVSCVSSCLGSFIDITWRSHHVVDNVYSLGERPILLNISPSNQKSILRSRTSLVNPSSPIRSPPCLSVPFCSPPSWPSPSTPKPTKRPSPNTAAATITVRCSPSSLYSPSPHLHQYPIPPLSIPFPFTQSLPSHPLTILHRLRQLQRRHHSLRLLHLPGLLGRRIPKRIRRGARSRRGSGVWHMLEIDRRNGQFGQCTEQRRE